MQPASPLTNRKELFIAVYLVTREDAAEGEKPRLVEARTKVAAIAHVARTSFAAETVSTKAAMAWAKEGVELEEASPEAE
jgi:hypothetical protein